MAKRRLPKVDGLSSHDIAKLRSAIRQVWHRSHMRKLCVSRAVDDDGFPVCEKCHQRVPKNYIDHIIAPGDLDGGYIERMFVPSTELQALCHECHKEKTKQERKLKKLSTPLDNT